ncbi:MAG: hypothetical protein R3F59_19155 [Myxococcota bacterium]
MPYESGEEPVFGDVVVRSGRSGTVVELHADELSVRLDGGTERWPIAVCRLRVPAEGIRPRPGWERAWVGSLGRRATHAVERGLIYIRRTDDDLFLVVDGRDDTAPHRIVDSRSGFPSVDEAYRVADALLARDPELRTLAEAIKREHPIVEDVGVVPFVDSTGDDALRVVIVLQDRGGGQLYSYEELRPIALSIDAATGDQERLVYTTFRLSSEMGADTQDEALGVQ